MLVEMVRIIAIITQMDEYKIESTVILNDLSPKAVVFKRVKMSTPTSNTIQNQ
jgi:hypothetical protein